MERSDQIRELTQIAQELIKSAETLQIYGMFEQEINLRIEARAVQARIDQLQNEVLAIIIFGERVLERTE